jgi:hypothetical protein
MKNVIIFGIALSAFVAVGALFATRIGDTTAGGRSGGDRRPPYSRITESAGRTETVRKLGSFNSISLPSSGTVRVHIGAEPSVTVRADGRTIERVETAIHGDELVLSVRGPNFGSAVEYEVTTPSLQAVRISGSGDIIFQDTISGKNMSVDIAGSGSFTGTVDTDSLSVDIKGSGDVKIGGTAEKADFKIFGSGDLDAGDLGGGSATVAVMGSGDTNLGVFEDLNARVMGSGDVEYQGTPRVSATTPGSGEVTRR